ncbi:type VI secretion system tube protein Hcp [Pantoea sp. EKM21T]|nr:type VI secretion system tube protein Hcp [Pantoea sp. EKM21T]KAF6677260.1 type VI secretion system tube protein Hcp [Pantoea sp. EKM22T]
MDAGIETEYFNIILKNVKVTTVSPCLSPSGMISTHLETPELRYAAITWKYAEGNIIYRGTWNERATA